MAEFTISGRTTAKTEALLYISKKIAGYDSLKGFNTIGEDDLSFFKFGQNKQVLGLVVSYTSS